MQLLPLEYNKNNYHYRQVYRDQFVAIYIQEDEGVPVGYEVCEILHAPEQEVFGKVVPAREKLPATEQWGRKAWTVKTFEQALEKKNERLLTFIANNGQHTN